MSIAALGNSAGRLRAVHCHGVVGGTSVGRFSLLSAASSLLF